MLSGTVKMAIPRIQLLWFLFHQAFNRHDATAFTIPTTLQRPSSSLTQRAALLPLEVADVQALIQNTGKPTPLQYESYWGRTRKEHYGSLLESAIVAVLGCTFSYFMSFVIGGFVATILGTLFLFWGILSPEFKAYQRNWEFLGGRSLVDVQHTHSHREGLYGGLFLGCIQRVGVVTDTDDPTSLPLSDFQDYTMETDENDRFLGQPNLLRLQLVDRVGRQLQIHCRLSEDYLHLQNGLPVCTLLLSKSPRFVQLAALTDVYVFDEDYGGCWIGDYPYLNRPEMENLLAEDDEIWDLFLREAVNEEEDDDDIDASRENMEHDRNAENTVAVPRRRRR